MGSIWSILYSIIFISLILTSQCSADAEDPCEKNNGGCEQTCTKSGGSPMLPGGTAICSCNTGTLNTNGRTCDPDDCQDDADPIPSSCTFGGSLSCSDPQLNVPWSCNYAWKDAEVCDSSTAGQVKDTCKKSCNNCCNQTNKQKSIYGQYVYTPSLVENPVTEAYVSAKGVLVEPLRKHGGNGIYDATTLGTIQDNGDTGVSGYFGVQWKGHVWDNDMLLFSIWDTHTDDVLYALPNHPNCKRNCNDCFEEETTGTKCFFNLPQRLQEGDELELRIEREEVESIPYLDIDRKGHVWKVKVRYASGPNKEHFMANQFGLNEDDYFTVGRILFEDRDLNIGSVSSGGITHLASFHEHLGCTPCGSFSFEAEVSGPYIVRAKDNENVPKLIESRGEFHACGSACTCHLFDIKSYEFGKLVFQTGPGFMPDWSDLTEKPKMYWTENGEKYALNAPIKECLDVWTSTRCGKRLEKGTCGYKRVAENCEKTCGLCN